MRKILAANIAAERFFGYDGHALAGAQTDLIVPARLRQPDAPPQVPTPDLTTIDLTDVPQANVGDEVTILDNDPLSPASVYRLAQLAETIPYEIFCRIGPRVHRVVQEPIRHLGEIPGDGDAFGIEFRA